MGTAIWLSTKTRPQRIESLSKTGLYPSGAVSLSSRLMLALTRVISGSIAIFEIKVFTSSMKLNPAFFMFSSVIFLFLVSLPTMWFLWIFSLPSVWYLLRSTIGRLSPRIITLSSSVSTVF